MNFSLFLAFSSASSSITEEWYRTWGGNEDVIATAVKVDSHDNIYIAGMSDGYFKEMTEWVKKKV